MVDKKQLLYILMNGILIGKLKKLSPNNLSFTYEESWLNSPNVRPISLSMPIVKQHYEGDIVYNFFDNLLPDNSDIRNKIQTQFHTPTLHPFDLLAAVGKDCIGAIQMTHEAIPQAQKMEFLPINEKEIASILKSTKQYPLGMRNEIPEFRISIAGAQEKSAFLFWQGKWNIPLGSTPTTHIFKLPIGFIKHQNLDLSDSCENEWLCSKIAEAFGLPTAKCNIQYFEDVKTLIVERFDRKFTENGKSILRLPQEDMCQALGFSPNLKYQTDGGPGIAKIMELLLGSEKSNEDREIFMKTQVLFWLLAAIDGHAKNFSIRIAPEGRFSMTPLYDIISAFPLVSRNQLEMQKIKMAMALKGKKNHYRWHELQNRYFIETAKDANFSVVKTAEIIDEMVSKTDSVIEAVSQNLPNNFPDKIAIPIFEGMRKAKNILI